MMSSSALALADFADTPSPDPDWKLIHRIADDRVDTATSFMIATIKRQRERLPLGAMADAFEAGRIGAELMSLAEWQQDFDGLVPILEDTLTAAGNASARLLGHRDDTVVIRKQFLLSFDSQNPEVQRWLDTHTPNLQANITRESQDAVREIIGEGYRKGWPPRDAARRIRGAVGLTRRQARALARIRDNLESSGIGGRRLERALQRHETRFLRQRALVIARNETLLAANKGQEALWGQAMDAGNLPQNAKRVWITTPDERLCPLCIPMEGRITGMREPWSTPQGRVFTPQEIHVQCRCAEGLASESEQKARLISDRADALLRDSPIDWEYTRQLVRADKKLGRDITRRELAERIARAEIEAKLDLLRLGGDTQAIFSTGGKWNRSRVVLHNKVMREFFAGKVGNKRQPLAIVTGGRTGAGKSTSLGKLDKSKFVTVNADEVKTLKTYADATPSPWAAATHEESSWVKNRIFNGAVQGRYDMLLDVTMAGEKSMRRQLAALSRAGYRIEFRFTDVGETTSLHSSVMRFLRDDLNGRQGRWVPTDFIMSNADSTGRWQSNSRRVYETLKEGGWDVDGVNVKPDAWQAWDNDGWLNGILDGQRREATLIETAGEFRKVAFNLWRLDHHA